MSLLSDTQPLTMLVTCQVSRHHATVNVLCEGGGPHREVVSSVLSIGHWVSRLGVGGPRARPSPDYQLIETPRSLHGAGVNLGSLCLFYEPETAQRYNNPLESLYYPANCRDR